jgi:hypothetical protein
LKNASFGKLAGIKFSSGFSTVQGSPIEGARARYNVSSMGEIGHGGTDEGGGHGGFFWVFILRGQADGVPTSVGLGIARVQKDGTATAPTSPRVAKKRRGIF